MIPVWAPLPAQASFLTQAGPALVLPLRYCDFQAPRPEEHGLPCTKVTARAVGMLNSVMPGITSFASNEAAVPAPSGAEVEQLHVLRSNASPFKLRTFMADLARALSLTLHLLASLASAGATGTCPQQRHIVSTADDSYLWRCRTCRRHPGSNRWRRSTPPCSALRCRTGHSLRCLGCRVSEQLQDRGQMSPSHRHVMSSDSHAQARVSKGPHQGGFHDNRTGSQTRCQPHVSLSSCCCLPRPWEGHLTHAQVTGRTPGILTDNERDICRMHRLWGNTQPLYRPGEGHLASSQGSPMRSFAREGRCMFSVEGCAHPAHPGCCPWHG